MSERLGIFGGTFDPIHCAHIKAARAAQEAESLDRILFVVANRPWQKASDITDAEMRFQMVELGVKGEDGFEASRMEIDRGGDSYMADTIQVLKTMLPETRLYLILGADAAANITTWERYEEVLLNVKLIVVGRSSIELGELSAEFTFVEGNFLESSTEIRQKAAAGESLGDLVPPEVGLFIAEHGLYSGSR